MSFCHDFRIGKRFDICNYKKFIESLFKNISDKFRGYLGGAFLRDIWRFIGINSGYLVQKMPKRVRNKKRR